MMNGRIVCAACEAADPEIVVIGGLRRTSCPSCHHSQRVDVEPFDYTNFAMGGTGLAPERLAAQADFIAARAHLKLAAPQAIWPRRSANGGVSRLTTE